MVRSVIERLRPQAGGSQREQRERKVLQRKRGRNLRETVQENGETERRTESHCR